jgi:hypothetical protein
MTPALEDRIARLEDERDIIRIQNIYGFYLDNRMWREVADLFADDGEMEIGRRGVYRGRERIHRFMQDVLGGGRWGLLTNEIINHIQLQMVITVAPDRSTAQMRSRAIVQGSSPPGGPTQMQAEGLYENTYVRVNGAWLIQRLFWVPTFYFNVPGFESAVFESGPASAEMPPDGPPRPADADLGRAFLPFHYPHPMTGAAGKTPVSEV